MLLNEVVVMGMYVYVKIHPVVHLKLRSLSLTQLEEGGGRERRGKERRKEVPQTQYRAHLVSVIARP